MLVSVPHFQAHPHDSKMTVALPSSEGEAETVATEDATPTAATAH